MIYAAAKTGLFDQTHAFSIQVFKLVEDMRIGSCDFECIVLDVCGLNISVRHLDSSFSVKSSSIEYEVCTFVSLFLSDIHDILNPGRPLTGSWLTGPHIACNTIISIASHSNHRTTRAMEPEADDKAKKQGIIP